MDEIFVNKYRELYKNSGRGECQKERRRKLLAQQRKERQQEIDIHRGILSYVQTQPRDGRKAPAVFNRFYANKIQLSEWLKEKPEDFDNWFIVPCPKGKRCLVVASDRTRSYTKAGKLLHTFRTSLEGGKYGKYVTVLDCIFHQNAYYVLDCLVYKNQEFINCETSFRFFWLTSKFDEYDYTVIHRDNVLPLHLIPRFDCADEASLANSFETFPHWPDNSPTLDGYLFYHKEASYTYGSTPLVGWLFSFMLPEVLGINAIHPEYKKTPPDYTNAAAFMKAFDKRLKSKKHRPRRRHQMDVEDATTSTIMDQQKQLELGQLDMDCEYDKESDEDEKVVT